MPSTNEINRARVGGGGTASGTSVSSVALAVALAVFVVLAVAAARLYRGAHFPTDVLGSMLFAVPWLMITVALLRPRNSPADTVRGHAGPRIHRSGRLRDRSPLRDG